MTDFSAPVAGDYFLDVLTTLKARDVSTATMKFTADTNVPNETIRYNRTNRVFEEWNGTAWVEKYLEPAGIIKAYGGSSAPRGHLLCDGSVVSQATYADLYAIVGNTYNTGGEGAGNFRLPDLRRRMPLGKAASGSASTLGETGGSFDHTHVVSRHHHGMGTGADLNITSSGGHTTTIDISHGHSASVGSNSTGVTAGTDASEVSINDPGHSHTYGLKSGGSGSYSSTRAATGLSTGGTNETFTVNGTGTGISLNNGNHVHGVNISDPGHGHSVTVDSLGTTNRQDTSGVHTHNSASVAGRIGTVTGGVDGNSDMTSGAANPPYIVLNFIITI